MTNKLLVPESVNLLDQMKNEIAAELGITLNGDTPSRLTGKVGGQMVKRLIEMAKKGL
jgi:hypothetical protein